MTYQPLKNFSIEPSWDAVIGKEYHQPYFAKLAEFVREQRTSGRQIFPPKDLVFNALKSTPYTNAKVVIIGQDPYHNVGQAHGLSFSVPVGVPMPPSLKNIFKELQADLGISPPPHGCLQKWTDQGVLMLNATLTVEQHTPLSHSKQGWEQFTDAIVQALASHPNRLVFLLWGRHAKLKAASLEGSHHHLLVAAHPSPFSAHNGFFGCHHFSKANELLVADGLKPIDWSAF